MAEAQRRKTEGQLYDEKRSPNLYHITYKENGESKEFWVDKASGFTYRHRPILRKRGFVELLYDGEVVYVLNIREERFIPYRNWEIRADERLCAIGNKLYFNEEKDGRYKAERTEIRAERELSLELIRNLI